MIPLPRHTLLRPPVVRREEPEPFVVERVA